MELTSGQKAALDKMKAFVMSEDKKAFILSGYAGTGKTTLVKELLEYLKSESIHYQLLASTGRAAKILANTTGESEVKTVHSLVYEYKGFNEDIMNLADLQSRGLADESGQLIIWFVPTSIDSKGTTVYIVDESSMISNSPTGDSIQAKFGEGRLLEDLFHFDSNGKFIFVGDACQLPPVNQSFSPALSSDYLSREFNLKTDSAELTQIVRQDSNNDITIAADQLRRLYMHPQSGKCATFPLNNLRNVHLVNSEQQLLSMYINDIRQHGFNYSTFLAKSNRQCNENSAIIRSALGFHGSRLMAGELLLITQNNLISGLMNGDLVEVLEVGRQETRAGLTFTVVKMKELFTGNENTQSVIDDVLYSNRTNLTSEQQKSLYIDYAIRMKKNGFKQESEAFKEGLRKDQYLNAVRCCFGYVLTCHKSQGGEWKKVYLSIPRGFPFDEDRRYVYQWVYTAVTRAREELYLPDDYFIDGYWNRHPRYGFYSGNGGRRRF